MPDHAKADTHLDKSLEELEDIQWGEAAFNSRLVGEVHRLRRIPLKQYRIEDLRLMIGQGEGLKHLVPLALQHLENIL